MEIKYYGANCVRIVTKKKSITIDDNIKKLGGKTVAKPEDAVFLTNKLIFSRDDYSEDMFVVGNPGEYELGNIMVQGFSVKSHLDHENDKNGVIYKLVIDRTSIVILGHVDPLSVEGLLEDIGIVDVLFLPVGGNGYTLNSHDALKLAHKIDPRIIVPTHYHDKELKYEVAQEPVEAFLKELNQETEELDSLKTKPGSVIESGSAKVILLKKS